MSRRGPWGDQAPNSDVFRRERNLHMAMVPDVAEIGKMAWALRAADGLSARPTFPALISLLFRNVENFGHFRFPAGASVHLRW